MKVRMGFVSNSSSSSFCIYGAFLSEVPLAVKQYKKVAKVVDGDNEDEEDEDEEDEDYDDDGYELMEHRASQLGLQCEYPEGYDGYYVGLAWSDIKDDETGKQFKERVEGLLTEFCGEKVECETHEEAFYS